MQPRVLVVDDSLTVRKLVELSFRSGMCQVEFAGSGGEALAKARLLRPNLMLLDYVLPDMKGTDLCRLLAADDALRDVPIVVMSAKQASLRERFREFPAVVSFLQKPFTVEAITGRVASVLNRSQPPAGSSSGDSTDARPALETSFSHGQKEAAAKALYARLSQQFARIPEWIPALGDANPATFFGKKILSPAVMDQLLGTLVPLCREMLAAPVPAAASVAASPDLDLGATYERAADFSRKVQTLELSARERQFLSLVDGRRTMASIVDQTRMKSSQALAILRRMQELDLVRPAAAPAAGGGRTVPKVLVFEPDARVFRRQLERLLRERADPLEMVAVSRPEELAPSVAREPPRLVLLNATAAGDKAAGIAPAVREASAGAATKIAAMLEMPSPAQGRQFSVAGFDAVLVKPIPYTDIDALLTTSGFS